MWIIKVNYFYLNKFVGRRVKLLNSGKNLQSCFVSKKVRIRIYFIGQESSSDHSSLHLSLLFIFKLILLFFSLFFYPFSFSYSSVFFLSISFLLNFLYFFPSHSPNRWRFAVERWIRWTLERKCGFIPRSSFNLLIKGNLSISHRSLI